METANDSAKIEEILLCFLPSPAASIVCLFHHPASHTEQSTQTQISLCRMWCLVWVYSAIHIEVIDASKGSEIDLFKLYNGKDLKCPNS